MRTQVFWARYQARLYALCIRQDVIISHNELNTACWNERATRQVSQGTDGVLYARGSDAPCVIQLVGVPDGHSMAAFAAGDTCA